MNVFTQFSRSYFSFGVYVSVRKKSKEAAWNSHRIGPGAAPTLMCEPPNGDLYSFKSSLCTSARREGRFFLDQNFAFDKNRVCLCLVVKPINDF